jgi:hypothetical protein
LRGTPVALLIFLYPSVQFKPIKGNTLRADWNFRELWTHLGVEPVPVHAEVMGGVAKAQKPRSNARVAVDEPLSIVHGVRS